MNLEPVPEKEFLANRRSVLLSYPVYAAQATDQIETLEIVTASLADPQKVAGMPADRPFVASQQRAWDSVDYLHIQYSAGAPTALLSSFLPVVLDYWEQYAAYSARYNETTSRVVAHLTLGDHGYWKAIRLTSFAILCGELDRLSNLCAIWDYGNQPLDGLLERLVAPFAPGRQPPPDDCTRHLPYFKLLKVFDAAAAERPALMARYMDDWYEASRREPYYRSHTKGREHSFLGYWSFEAAAVTQVLGIDDSSYRDHEFYPKDLVDFARSLSANVPSSGDERGAAARRMRIEGGKPCPREGWWFTPAKADSRRRFKEGELMPDFNSDYGATIWQWDTNQAP